MEQSMQDIPKVKRHVCSTDALVDYFFLNPGQWCLLVINCKWWWIGALFFLLIRRVVLFSPYSMTLSPVVRGETTYVQKKSLESKFVCCRFAHVEAKKQTNKRKLQYVEGGSLKYERLRTGNIRQPQDGWLIQGEFHECRLQGVNCPFPLLNVF